MVHQKNRFILGKYSGLQLAVKVKCHTIRLRQVFKFLLGVALSQSKFDYKIEDEGNLVNQIPSSKHQSGHWWWIVSSNCDC